MCLVCLCMYTDGEDAAAPSADTRAELLLDVMLGTLLQHSEPPSLAHLLLGFDTSTPPTQWYYQELVPQHDYSCLSVLLRALQVSLNSGFVGHDDGVLFLLQTLCRVGVYLQHASRQNTCWHRPGHAY